MHIAFASSLHVLSAVLWVGGMFFAYHILRPSMGELEGPSRLKLWRSVFQRFFWVVLVIVVLLPLTGYVMLFGVYGGSGGAGVAIHIMHFLGWVMIGFFAWLYFLSWPRFRKAVDAGEYEEAANALVPIRRIVASNLGMGLIVVVIAAAGRYWY